MNASRSTGIQRGEGCQCLGNDAASVVPRNIPGHVQFESPGGQHVVTEPRKEILESDPSGLEHRVRLARLRCPAAHSP